MHWRTWNDESFAYARSRSAPVLLFLTAAWCRYCRELEELVLGDEEVERLIEQSFVPIRVDKDRRPDIDARYSKGGWPTLAYLDDQGEMIASDAYLEPEELLPRLKLIANYYAENRAAVQRRLAEAAENAERPARKPKRGELGRDLVDWVAKHVLETADPVHGGFGREHKFPHFEALDFALIRWSQTGDEAMRKLVVRTLRGMQHGEIHDRVEGGFYRYATQPDWSRPHYEKMLDANAQRLFSYLEAYQAFGDPSFRTTAEGILGWMLATLLDPQTGAFRGSQDADPSYAHLQTKSARAEYGAPPCDATIFANWNAIAASALFKAATVLGREELATAALRTLDFVLEEMFDERDGVYHYWDGTYHLPGMLTDQAYTLRALVDAMQFAGENRFLEPARKLAALTIESLSSSEGGFYDLRHDPTARGSLKRRNRSILENAVTAEALLRLALLAHEDDWIAKARETLEAFADEYKRYGPFVAGYARAVDLLLHPPVHVIIVGAAGSKETQELRRAALAPYVASRVVQVIDPERDGELLERSGLPANDGQPSHAYVRRGRESYAETTDPSRLLVLMARVERGS